MKTKYFLLISILCLSLPAMAGPADDAAGTFINSIKNARNMRALITINDVVASNQQGKPISNTALLYVDLNNQKAALDSLLNMHTRYQYASGRIVQSTHFKRDAKQIYSDTSLHPENSITEINSTIDEALSKVLLWVTRNPRLFTSREAPSQFGIADSGWAKSWLRLNIPGLPYQIFWGFINEGLTSVLIADTQNKLLYTVQVKKIEFSQNIPAEKFKLFRKHPIDETPSTAERWWRDVFYRSAQ